MPKQMSPRKGREWEGSALLPNAKLPPLVVKIGFGGLEDLCVGPDEGGILYMHREEEARPARESAM